MTEKAEKKKRGWLEALFWLGLTLLAAWAWRKWGQPLWNRIPFWWRIVLGCLAAGALLFLAREPWWAGAVLLSTLAPLWKASHAKEKVDPKALEQEKWMQLVDENPVLQRVFVGSRIDVRVPHQLWVIELAGGRTPAEAKALKPNLESAFDTAPGALRVEGDPTSARRVVVGSGDMPWERPTEAPTTGPRDITSEAIVIQPKRLTRGSAPARARARARGVWRRISVGRKVDRAAELAELKRKANLARERGERTHKGGHRRSK